MTKDSRWQPTIIGSRIRLRPLRKEDFDPLTKVASDPLIWEQHSEPERHQREVFRLFLDSGLESRGALTIIDHSTGKPIGSSRFTSRLEGKPSSIEIGHTFLARPYWGKGFNSELKALMLQFAYDQVDTVFFSVYDKNFRSLKAVKKLGALERGTETRVLPDGRKSPYIVFEMHKSNWAGKAYAESLTFSLAHLETPRLVLEPVNGAHAGALLELARDPEMHRYLEYEPKSLEDQTHCCQESSRCRSPDGKELFLNWAARDKNTGRIVGHFQAAVDLQAVATIGYLVGKDAQGKGIAFEGMEAVFSYLRERIDVMEIKAVCDARNIPAHKLASKLQMKQVGHLIGSAVIRGETCDEYVFSRAF